MSRWHCTLQLTCCSVAVEVDEERRQREDERQEAWSGAATNNTWRSERSATAAAWLSGMALRRPAYWRGNSPSYQLPPWDIHL